MITVIAKNYIKKEKLDNALILCKELVEQTRKENGCIKYEVHQDLKDESVLTMIEEWEDQACLDDHMKAEHFTRIVPLLGELANKEGEINIYRKII